MVAQPTSTNRKAAIARALDRAQAQASMGNRPVLLQALVDGAAIRETWQVSSRTTAGQTYRVELVHSAAAITTECDCQAAEKGLLCWHRGAARLGHSDAIRYTNRAGLRLRPR